MTKPSALPLPTPVAMPAPRPAVHNATAYERAVGLAHEMADRHAHGDYNVAADAQTRDTIDHLVGRFVDGEMAWPSTLIAISGTTQRRALK